MKFEEALKAMRSGSKAKLPSWGGYWYWSPEKETIIMHTKDGQELDIRETQSVVYTLQNILYVKDQVYAALCTVSENVSDAYPRSWAEGSTIQYTEEQNDVYEASSDAEGMREDKALVRYRIDIWNNHSTSEAALQVDEAMKVTGLKRIACADVPDPSGMKHKQMRYEGIIDMDSDSVYWR